MTGLEKWEQKTAAPSDLILFHAGTVCQDGHYVTSGGRVLGVTALAADLSLARQKSYQAIQEIHFDGMHYRTDIGMKALK